MSEPERQIREPIVIVGSPRSGTTLLGNLIGRHPEVAYWEEPRTIWSQGNAWRFDDHLNAEDFTEGIARKIDDRFSRFLAASGKTRFAEKTPSNCLRLPFIRAVYPDARIIHLVRDGRAVVASMLRMLEKPPDRGRLAARLRETPWRDLPSLTPLLVRDVIAPRFRKGGKSFWGPRPPGWRAWLDFPVPATLARQWKALVETAQTDAALFPEKQRCEIHYEDLVGDPERSMKMIEEATGLKNLEAGEEMFSDRTEAWRDALGAETIGLIETEAGDLLQTLGYPLTTATP